MDILTGIIPTLVKMIEHPGNGEIKKEIVMNATKEVLKVNNLYNPLLDAAISAMIDGIAGLLKN
ncbi:hypothetical protein OSSY52_03480 [Tepiditoga spiralis]|uniref:Uncharacterized protein n=1 Tax=Tepiditoga spiralis TaxID=2108365 RepID=A0A7G1G5N8_9BACT|nr:hypothetical protein [Tepiditoga spiralis]BBE30207.1 hypothetical protein OSSY52_03480 [Tepiditoga spiralis]